MFIRHGVVGIRSFSMKKVFCLALVIMGLNGSVYLHFFKKDPPRLRTNESVKILIPVPLSNLKTNIENARMPPRIGSAENPIRALHVALEYNQAEVGGIAAVTKTLVPKLNENGFDIKVDAKLIMPGYSFLQLEPARLKKIATVSHRFRKVFVQSDIFLFGTSLFLVRPADADSSEIYNIRDKNGVYTEDDHYLPIERWLHFNSAVAAFVSEYKEPQWSRGFDILHAHSYHAGLAIELLDLYENKRFEHKLRKPKTILHMHGLSYDQGWIKGVLFESVGLSSSQVWDNMTRRILEKVDYVITVSQNMHAEVLSDDEKKNYGLRDQMKKLHDASKVVPVLNGINSSQWNPMDERVLPPREGISYTFDDTNVHEGKIKIRNLLVELGFFTDAVGPLVTFVGRFSDEKGIEHLHAAAFEVIKQGGSFAILGSYGKSYNSRQMISRLIDLAKKPPFLGKLLIVDTVEAQQLNSLGNFIRAASDFAFVPSKEETCGLVPLEFFGFGALTITSHAGGLKDTVVPYEDRDKFFNGFVFNYDDSDQLHWSIKSACDMFNNDFSKLEEMQRRVMQTAHLFDWSTPEGPVSKILKVYENAVSL